MGEATGRALIDLNVHGCVRGGDVVRAEEDDPHPDDVLLLGLLPELIVVGLKFLFEHSHDEMRSVRSARLRFKRVETEKVTDLVGRENAAVARRVDVGQGERGLGNGGGTPEAEDLGRQGGVGGRGREAQATGELDHDDRESQSVIIALERKRARGGEAGVERDRETDAGRLVGDLEGLWVGEGVGAVGVENLKVVHV